MNIIKQCKYGKMIINRRDSWVGDSLDIYGEYSEGEVEVFRKYIKPGDLVLDIGANIGAHTVALSQIVGETGLVIAYEPERYNYYTLCGNLAINNIRNVIAFQQAVGNRLGTIDVPICDVAITDNYGALELDRDWSGMLTYKVPITTVDSLKLNNCAFIKIDVEGMEKEVLEGGIETIINYKPIILLEDERKDKSIELKKNINELGYKFEECYTPYFNSSNFNKEKYNIFGNRSSLNLLCFN